MALEGTLRDMPFADLFDIFRAGRRSGRLLVSREEERGLIFVGAGQLLDAVLVTDLDGSNAAFAEEAAARILSWPEASFIFEHDPTVIQRPRRIERDASWFFASLARVSHPPITLRSRLRPAMPGHDTSGPFTLNVEEWRLLSALWLHHTLSMACVELEIDTHSGLHLAQALVRRGLLTVVDEKEAPRATSRGQDLGQSAMGVPPLRHIAHSHPAAPPPQSQLLQAIMRRVRAL
jgi:hypothetical protein